MKHTGPGVQGSANGASFAFAVVLFLLFVSGLPAEEPVLRQFDIPPQPLASALIAFSEQADLQILVASQLIDNRRTTGIEGRLSPTDALAALLESQPLTFRYVSADTVAISPADHHVDDAAPREREPKAEALTTGTP